MTSPVTDRQIDAVLELLADGNPHQFTELADHAGTNHLNTIAAELRQRGHDVRSWRMPLGRDEKNRPLATWYFRLVTDSALEAVGVPSLAATAPAASSAGVAELGESGSAQSTRRERAEGSTPSSPCDSRASALDFQLELA